MRGLMLAGWATWCVGMVFFAFRTPDLYVVACGLLTATWYLTSRRPGMLTAIATMDPSGKHDRGLAQGCWPITLVFDFATAPCQIPALVPFAKDYLLRTRDSMRIGAAVRSPATVRRLVDKARSEALEDWELEALKEACQVEDSIAPEDVRTLIELFGGTLGDRDSDQGLAWLIDRQPFTVADLRRAFEIEKGRGHVERSIRVSRHVRALHELASHPDAPTDILRGIDEIESIGQAKHVARERLRERGE